MVPNPAIRNLIREDKIHQIYSQMQVGQAKFGMQTINQSLAALSQRAADHARTRRWRSLGPRRAANILATGGGSPAAPPARPAVIDPRRG